MEASTTSGGSATPGSTTATPWQEQIIPGDYEERPELYVGAAFAGGLILAMILRKLGPDE